MSPLANLKLIAGLVVFSLDTGNTKFPTCKVQACTCVDTILKTNKKTKKSRTSLLPSEKKNRHEIQAVGG